MKKTYPLLLHALFISSLISLGFLNLSSLAEPVSSVEAKKIKQVLSTYVRAFEKARFSLLRESCSVEYLTSMGGKKRLEMALKQVQTQYKGASLKKLKLHSINSNEVFVTFQITGPKGIIEEMKDKWLLLKKSTTQPSMSQWKIVSLHPDFTPETPQLTQQPD